MRLVHFADWHLGYRAYQRQTPTGINQREADVALAVRRCVDAALAVEPALVVLAGDVFHTPRPSNHALVHAVQQVARLTRVCPVVVVAGNHDSPRATDGGSALPLLASVGAHVVVHAPARVRVGTVAVWGVPDTGVPQPRPLTPDPGARHNVALIHGEVAGVIPGAPARAHEMSREALAGEAWDYIALGHYHVQQQVAPRAWYAGAPDYTSSDPWAEVGAPRGGLVVDLDAGTVRPLPIEPPRRFVDLPRVSAAGLAPDALVAAIEAAMGDPTGAVVRQVVTDCEPTVAREVTRTALRRWRRDALHVLFDVRRPARAVTAGAASTRSRQSLAEMLAEVLIRRSRATGVEADALLALGRTYLARAEEASADAPALDAVCPSYPPGANA